MRMNFNRNKKKLINGNCSGGFSFKMFEQSKAPRWALYARNRGNEFWVFGVHGFYYCTEELSRASMIQRAGNHRLWAPR